MEKFVLRIEKIRKYWTFNDIEKDIVSEAFVQGSSELISYIAEGKGLSKKELNLIVSDTKFEDSQETSLISHSEITKWTVYHHKKFGTHMLCPVLLDYFKKAPDQLFFKLENIGEEKCI